MKPANQKRANSHIIGAHVSAAGGHAQALARAADLGCNCVQVFAGSPRGWKRPDLSSIDTQLIFKEQKRLSVNPIFTHALYLVNLASDNSELVDKSFTALKADLEFDALVGGAGVIVHLGSHQGRGWEAVRGPVAEQIVKLLNSTPPDSTFLIENSAGQNGKLCSDLSEIRWLLDRVGELEKSSVGRLGWCVDTCHAHAAGYFLGQSSPDWQGQATLLSAEKAMKNPNRGSLFQAIFDLNLLSSLSLIHVNGSHDPFASGRDRHANLGEGELSPADIQHFINQPQLTHLPLILEVPGFEGQGPDKKNVGRLQSWLN